MIYGVNFFLSINLIVKKALFFFDNYSTT